MLFTLPMTFPFLCLKYFLSIVRSINNSSFIIPTCLSLSIVLTRRNEMGRDIALKLYVPPTLSATLGINLKTYRSIHVYNINYTRCRPSEGRFIIVHPLQP